LEEDVRTSRGSRRRSPTATPWASCPPSRGD